MLIGRRLNDYQATKGARAARWDANTRGHFVIVPHVPAPLI